MILHRDSLYNDYKETDKEVTVITPAQLDVPSKVIS